MIYFSQAFTACTQLKEHSSGSDLNDSVVGPSGKPLVARVDCDASHPSKMPADNLQGWVCTLLWYTNYTKTELKITHIAVQVTRPFTSISCRSHDHTCTCHMQVT